MKGYLIFGYAHYYPGGGWSDFKGYATTLNEARLLKDAKRAEDDARDAITWDEWQIVDLETLKVVEGGL